MSKPYVGGQPTGEHKTLPDGYCPDRCGAPCMWKPAGQGRRCSCGEEQFTFTDVEQMRVSRLTAFSLPAAPRLSDEQAAHGAIPDSPTHVDRVHEPVIDQAISQASRSRLPSSQERTPERTAACGEDSTHEGATPRDCPECLRVHG